RCHRAYLHHDKSGSMAASAPENLSGALGEESARDEPSAHAGGTGCGESRSKLRHGVGLLDGVRVSNMRLTTAKKKPVDHPHTRTRVSASPAPNSRHSAGSTRSP